MSRRVELQINKFREKAFKTVPRITENILYLYFDVKWSVTKLMNSIKKYFIRASQIRFSDDIFVINDSKKLITTRQRHKSEPEQ